MLLLAWEEKLWTLDLMKSTGLLGNRWPKVGLDDGHWIGSLEDDDAVPEACGGLKVRGEDPLDVVVGHGTGGVAGVLVKGKRNR